jgi:hypothetical protein
MGDAVLRRGSHAKWSEATQGSAPKNTAARSEYSFVTALIGERSAHAAMRTQRSDGSASRNGVLWVSDVGS